MRFGWRKALAGVGLLAALGLLAWSRSPAPAPLSTAPSSTATAAKVLARGPDLRRKELGGVAPYIPPQCYTKTRGDDGKVHNPCYTCHAGPEVPNYIEDAELQLSFAFPAPALENPWQNLFVDRRSAAAAISDEAILSYVRTSNYVAEGGRLLLAEALANPPQDWDMDGDGRFAGYHPDAYFVFDAQGFDKAPSGEDTGWRAYSYYPFPGTFWPANGSAGDALIRLPASFRKNERAELDRQTYVVNLAILEALIKRESVSIAPTDERRFGVDLDKDGRLGQATRVAYAWAPLKKRLMTFVGLARIEQEQAKRIPAAGLFPVGTELLHSVRYLDVVNGKVSPSARFKELRYARKGSYRTYSDLELAALAEGKEKHDFPDRLRQVLGDIEHGVNNGQGWTYQGFIESDAGDLRPQTYAESVYCVGCHGGLGATVDGTFTFARKLPASAEQRGWFHVTQRGLEGIPEPRRKDGRPEYRFYLEQNGAGDELRDNGEIVRRFFDAAGRLRPKMLAELSTDISVLLLPSAERALAMNKAYRTVVLEQSFERGREAPLAPAHNVHRRVEPDESTGIALAVAQR